MFQQTRLTNDESYLQSQIKIQEKPLRYIVDSATSDRHMKFVHPESIDFDSDLRMKPTRLNYDTRTNCEVYGTAPYRMKRMTGFIDNDMMYLSEQSKERQRRITEKQFPLVGDLNIDSFENVLDNDLRATSTRVDYRNQNSDNLNCRRI